jgi:ELWxxDGT repeat protein
MRDVMVGSMVKKWVSGFKQATRPAESSRQASEFMLEPLEGRILLAADLTGLATAYHTLASPNIPTNLEVATIKVTNKGNATAAASVLRVYASIDSTFSTSDVLLGTKTTDALGVGKSRDVEVDLKLPNTLAAGTYKLLSRVDATNVVAEGTFGEGNNTVVGPSFTVAWQFGAVPGRSGNTVLTLKDVDGTVVTFKLTGPGVGTVVKDGTNWDLKLTGTNTTSAVTITTSGGDGRVRLNDIQTAGSLASFNAATTDVNGTVAINGTISTLTLGDVLGGNIAAKSITTFTARNLTNAKLYIGTTLGQDGKLGGTGTNLDTYGHGQLKTFVLTGSMTGSTVRVSVNPVDGIFGNANDTFSHIPLVVSGIGSIKILGTLSADSRFITPTKPSTYLLAGLTKTTTGDSRFVTNLTNQPPVANIDAFTVKNSSGTPVLVKDINTNTNPYGPASLVNVNGTVYFTAYRPDLGRELWKSDGTNGGTVLVKDIVDGSGSSNPEHLTNVNGTLFFTAETAANGRELWRVDGTAGAVLVKDINPNSGYGISHLLDDLFVNVNGKLFFTANNGTDGVELWTSDGTEAGTVMVKNLTATGSSSLINLISFKGRLFFMTYGGRDLWTSDGTGPGTQVVRHFGTFQQNPELVVVGNNLYFTADDGVYGAEVWKTDGTPDGTVLLKDVNAYTGFGITGSGPANLTNVNGKLFFTANDFVSGYELWMSDGTATVLVRDLTPGTLQQSNSTSFTDLMGVGDQLFFRAFVPGVTTQYELWRSNGTESGTVRLAPNGLDLPGLANGSPLITDVNGVAYFRAANYDLWKSDGTVAGTKLVKAEANVRDLVNANGTLFFSGQYNATGYGNELWKIGPATVLLNGNVLTNDRDPNGNPLTAALVTGPSKGTLTLNANGTFTYRPNAGFIGTDTFTYRASDGALQSTPATVTITVTA